jgi:hypothetical protein
MLEAGVDVVMSDADVVWLKDPLELARAATTDAVPEMGGQVSGVQPVAVVAPEIMGARVTQRAEMLPGVGARGEECPWVPAATELLDVVAPLFSRATMSIGELPAAGAMRTLASNYMQVPALLLNTPTVGRLPQRESMAERHHEEAFKYACAGADAHGLHVVALDAAHAAAHRTG